MKRIILLSLSFFLVGCYGTKHVSYDEFNTRALATVNKNVAIETISVSGTAFKEKISFSVSENDVYDLYASYLYFVDKYSKNEIRTYQYVYPYITPFGYPEFLKEQAIEFPEGVYYINNGFRVKYCSTFDEQNLTNTLKWDRNGILKSVEYPYNSIKVNVKVTFK